MRVLCVDYRGLKEGQQMDGDEKGLSNNHQHRPRPKSGAEQKGGGRIWVAEGLSNTGTIDSEWISWHNPFTEHTVS